MKTSRLQGVLVFDIEKPYKIAIAGKQEERTEIICKHINAKAEYAACDMEQLLVTALTSTRGQETNSPKAQMDKDQKEAEDFFKKESPTIGEIDQQAGAIKLMVKTGLIVRMSELFEKFYPIVCSRIFCAGDIPMTQTIWESISLRDKESIMFRYCTFFVNPLEVVLDMASSMENQPSSEAHKDLLTQ